MSLQAAGKHGLMEERCFAAPHVNRTGSTAGLWSLQSRAAGHRGAPGGSRATRGAKGAIGRRAGSCSSSAGHWEQLGEPHRGAGG